MSALTRAWTTYWFRADSTFRLGFFRIVIVLFQLWVVLNRNLINYGKRLNETADSLYDPEVVLRVLTLPFGYSGLRSIVSGPWGYRPTDLHLEVVHAIILIAGAFAVVGLFTRLALVLFAASNIFLQAFFYSFGEYHHPEALLMITLCVLPFAPMSASLSLDDLRRRLRRVDERKRFELFDIVTERAPFARWPLKLIAWLISLAYFSSAYTKWMRSGHDWVNGYTLQYYLVQDGLRWGSDLGVWLGGQHLLVVVMSWMTIIWEATFFLVLIFPALAIIYVPVGAGFHTGTHLFMRASFWQFHALYTSFVPWDRVVDWLRRRLAPSARPLALYDGLCPICLRSMTVVRYLDVLDRVRFADLETDGTAAVAGVISEPARLLSDDALRHEMHVIEPGGTIHRGYAAFRRIARSLPALWIFVPLMYLPGVSAVGSAAYTRVARTRLRLGRCGDGACGVSHAGKR